MQQLVFPNDNQNGSSLRLCSAESFTPPISNTEFGKGQEVAQRHVFNAQGLMLLSK